MPKALTVVAAMVKKLWAELFGTFALVFAGTGAIIINEVTSGSVTHVGIAFTFGLIILAMIYTFGDISGAHFNPAVTIGFWTAGRLPRREVLPYIASQCLGALLASGSLRVLFPQSRLLGASRKIRDTIKGKSSHGVAKFAPREHNWCGIRRGHLHSVA